MPVTLQIAGVADINETARPELAVAVRLNEPEPNVRAGNEPNEIVLMPAVTLNVFATGAAAA